MTSGPAVSSTMCGNFRGDFSHSLENEWLCAQLLHQLGIPVADTRVATFGTQKVLVVERFDRRWVGTDSDRVRAKGYSPAENVWIARLPQEDLHNAISPNLSMGSLVLTGAGRSAKYERAAD